MQKLLVIFIGLILQIVLMVAVSVGATRRDLIESGVTRSAPMPRRRASSHAAEFIAGDSGVVASRARMGRGPT